MSDREQAVERLLVEIRARRAEFAAQRRSSDDIVALLKPQHAFLSEGTWQSAGRLLLRLEASPGFP